jgi:hypothetical protein
MPNEQSVVQASQDAAAAQMAKNGPPSMGTGMPADVDTDTAPVAAPPPPAGALPVTAGGTQAPPPPAGAVPAPPAGATDVADHAEEKPGFVSTVAGDLGLPKTKKELYALGESYKPKNPMGGNAVPTKEELKNAEVSDPTKGIVDGLWGYAKRVAGNVYNDAHEEYEAARNISEGGPVGQNLGKAGAAVAHGIVANLPFVGEPLEEVAPSIAAGNYAEAAGHLTSSAAQMLAPELLHTYIEAHPSAAKVRLNAVKTAVNDHMVTDTAHQIRTTEHQTALDQVVHQQNVVDKTIQGEKDGTSTPQQTDAAREMLSKATANLEHTGQAVKDAAEKKAHAAAKVEIAQRDLESAAEKAKPKPKVKIGSPEEIKKSNEDFTTSIPSGPGKSAYTPEDLAKVRPLLENTHAGTTPVNSPQAVYDSMQSHFDRQETELKPWLDKYKDEHPSLGTNDDGTPASVKQRLVESLSEDEKGRPGFTEEALKVLENYENTTDPSISEAERLRKDLNDDNRGVLQKDRTDVATARATNPEFAGRYELAKIIREGTYGLLEDKGVLNAAKLRNLDASVIRVKNAAERMIPKADVKMRGSGEAGAIRKGGAFVAKKGGAVVGAGAGFAVGGPVGGEIGAFLGNAAGDKLAGALAPGDLTRSQRLARSMDVRHTTGEVPHLETTGNQPSNPPAFELPPKAEVPPKAVHPNDMTDLHADIAAYNGELPSPGSYEAQEAKFLSDYSIKRKYGILEPTDKKLFQQIGKAKIESSRASQAEMLEKAKEESQATKEAETEKAAKEAELVADENIAHSPVMKATEPAMEIDAADGRTSPQAHEHEHGHIMANVAEELEPFNFLSEHHPDAQATNAAAAVQTDVSGAKAGMEGLEQRVVGILGGPAFDEVHGDLRMSRNTGARSDISRARQILREEGGLKGDELNKVFDALYERAKGHVSNPEALALVEANAPLREKGLHKDYHMSPGRMSEYVKKLKGVYNGKTPTTAGIHEGGADGGVLEGEPSDAGGDGEEQDGSAEKVPAKEVRKSDGESKERGKGGTETSEVSKTPELRVPYKEGRTPPNETSVSPEADKAIKKGGGIPGGVQKGDAEIGVPDLAFIHDPTTGSSLALPPDKITPESVKALLQKSRDTYLKGEPQNSRIPKPGQPGYDPEIHGKVEQSDVSKNAIDHNEVLENIKRAYGVHDDPKLEHAGGFITPEGRYIDLPIDHSDAIARNGGEGSGDGPDNRKNFINESKAIRVHQARERGGKVLAFSVPADGVNPEQASAMERSFGANGDRTGLLRMERADIAPDTRNLLHTEKEFPSASDVKPMLQKIQAVEQSNLDHDVQGELAKTRDESRADRHAEMLHNTAEEGQKAFEAPRGNATNEQLAAHENTGGSTFSPSGQNLAGKDVYSVGAHPDRTQSVNKLTPEILDKYKADNADLLSDFATSKGDRAVGTWKDPDTGKSVLDVTHIHTDRDAAIAAGKAANQKGIYHLGGEGYIDTGGTGDGAVEQSDLAKSPKGSTVPLMKKPLDVEGTGENNKVNTFDVAAALNEHSQSKNPALKPGTDPEKMTDRAKSIMEDEAKYQLASGRTGKEWYTTEMKDHDKVLQEMRPELTQGPSIDAVPGHTAKLTLFKAAEAVLSAGQNPYNNFGAAIRAWDTYNETGEFPPTNPTTGKSWGPRSAEAYGNAMTSINRLISEKGEKGAADWLLADHTVKELRDYNKNVPGVMSTSAPGAMILGEKRGPFMQNLHGKEAAFTADMWVSRSWNRWMGTLEEPIIDKGGKESMRSDAPRNGAERGLMKESFEHTAKKLNLTTSSLQAVLWYYEQGLYSAHGVAKKSLSFSDAAKRVQSEEAATPESETNSFNFGDNEKQGGLADLAIPKVEPKKSGAVHAFDFLNKLKDRKGY